jgi:TRAP-type uncharacterized transport system substrate-binding protein
MFELINGKTRPHRWLSRSYGFAWLAAFVLPFTAAVHSAPIDRNLQRAKENEAAVMIVAGRPESTMMRIADDLAIALNDPDSGFHVVPVVGDGGIGNVRDLVLLRNIDLAITDLTVLEDMKEAKDLSLALHREVAHVLTLFPDKLTILARKTIRSLEELSGKRVSVGIREGGTAIHAKKIFDALGVDPELAYLASPDAAEALVKGDLDAFACFCLNSPGIYQRVMFNPDLHILPIPYTPEIGDDYLPTALVHKDFPSFISKDESVATVAVTLALVTYNWKKGNPRYSRVEDFVKRLLNNFSALQKPPRHPGWSAVQISAKTQDWPRFAAVTEWQGGRNADALQEMRVAFSEFLDRWKPKPASGKRTEQTKLFEEFLAWQGRER